LAILDGETKLLLRLLTPESIEVSLSMVITSEFADRAGSNLIGGNVRLGAARGGDVRSTKEAGREDGGGKGC